MNWDILIEIGAGFGIVFGAVFIVVVADIFVEWIKK